MKNECMVSEERQINKERNSIKRAFEAELKRAGLSGVNHGVEFDHWNYLIWIEASGDFSELTSRMQARFPEFIELGEREGRMEWGI